MMRRFLRSRLLLPRRRKLRRLGQRMRRKGGRCSRRGRKPDVQSVGEKEPTEAAKEKKKEDDDGEIDDGEIDVSMVEQARTLALQQTFLIQEKQTPLFLERWSVVGWTRYAVK